MMLPTYLRKGLLLMFSANAPRLPIVYDTPAAVMSRLFELDLTHDELVECVKYALRYYAECTTHDPSSAAGFLLWDKAIRALRDRLVPQGWMPITQKNYPTVQHPAGTFRISVAGGDEGTGKGASALTTRTDKGRATKDALAQNQSTMWGMRPDLAPLAVQTWLLVIHVDHLNDEVRAELALPLGLDEDDHISWWEERIILRAFPYERMPVTVSDQGDDDSNTGDEIIVTRRSS